MVTKRQQKRLTASRDRRIWRSGGCLIRSRIESQIACLVMATALPRPEGFDCLSIPRKLFSQARQRDRTSSSSEPQSESSLRPNSQTRDHEFEASDPPRKVASGTGIGRRRPTHSDKEAISPSDTHCVPVANRQWGHERGCAVYNAKGTVGFCRRTELEHAASNKVVSRLLRNCCCRCARLRLDLRSAFTRRTKSCRESIVSPCDRAGSGSIRRSIHAVA